MYKDTPLPLQELRLQLENGMILWDITATTYEGLPMKIKVPFNRVNLSVTEEPSIIRCIINHNKNVHTLYEVAIDNHKMLHLFEDYVKLTGERLTIHNWGTCGDNLINN